MFKGFYDGHIVFVLLEGCEGFRADALFGDTDGATKGEIVMGVVQEAEIGEHILNFLTLIKFDITNDCIGNRGVEEFFFKNAALGAGTGEDGNRL